jgi:hypothetical protein
LKNHQGLWVAYGFHATILGVVEKGFGPFRQNGAYSKLEFQKKEKKTP